MRCGVMPYKWWLLGNEYIINTSNHMSLYIYTAYLCSTLRRIYLLYFRSPSNKRTTFLDKRSHDRLPAYATNVKLARSDIVFATGNNWKDQFLPQSDQITFINQVIVRHQRIHMTINCIAYNRSYNCTRNIILLSIV